MSLPRAGCVPTFPSLGGRLILGNLDCPAQVPFSPIWPKLADLLLFLHLLGKQRQEPLLSNLHTAPEKGVAGCFSNKVDLSVAPADTAVISEVRARERGRQVEPEVLLAAQIFPSVCE